MASKLHNPKSYMPAAYIPAWLLQVSSEHLSLSAKILYGRLAQWSTTDSVVHRSTRQLAAEMGVHQRVVKRFLEELRKVKLIETYQKDLGGHNCYRFLDHEWIHAPLLDVFNYGKVAIPRDENVTTPVTKTSLPRDENVTPKVKEIKLNKKSFKTSSSSEDDVDCGGKAVDKSQPCAEKAGNSTALLKNRSTEGASTESGVLPESDFPVRIPPAYTEAPPSFDEFWAIYPKKVGKKEALRAWRKGKCDARAQEIIADVKKRSTTDQQWLRQTQYIPNPSTYLNQERWNDAILPVQPQPMRQQPHLKPQQGGAIARSIEWGPGHAGYEEQRREGNFNRTSGVQAMSDILKKIGRKSRHE